MKERPILFQAEMVQAILRGEKTQTRRIVKLPRGMSEPLELDERDKPVAIYDLSGCFSEVRCPYGTPGDRLWVQEAWGWRGSRTTWNEKDRPIEDYFIQYGADDSRQEFRRGEGHLSDVKPYEKPPGLPSQRPRKPDEDDFDRNSYLTSFWRSWRPAIYMPRWASRITLEVTGVRLEELHEISEADAKAEGTGHWLEETGVAFITLQRAYAALWDRVNGEGAWQSNPYVWVVEFKRVEP